MSDRLFHLIVSTIFALVALGHALRIYFGWAAMIGGWNVPMWLSWFAVIIAGGLSYLALSQKAHA